MATSAERQQPEFVPDLPRLVADFVSRNRLTGDELERLSEGRVKAARWGQIAKGQRLTNFPDPITIQTIADVTGYSVNVIVLATAKAVGLPVANSDQNRLTRQIPDAAGRLPYRVQAGILNLIENLVRQYEAEGRIGVSPQEVADRSRAHAIERHADESDDERAERRARIASVHAEVMEPYQESEANVASNRDRVLRATRGDEVADKDQAARKKFQDQFASGRYDWDDDLDVAAAERGRRAESDQA